MYSAKSSSGSQLRTVPANWEGRAGFYLPVGALGRLGWHSEGLAVPTAPWAAPRWVFFREMMEERRCQCGSKVSPPSVVPSPLGGDIGSFPARVSAMH